jgi:hypothetical protein
MKDLIVLLATYELLSEPVLKDIFFQIELMSTTLI